MSKKFLLSIVSPVYMNEGELHHTHSSIVKQIKATLPDIDYELIFVNDGSKDRSVEELHEIRQADRNVTVVNLSRNFGQFAAINAGVRLTRGDGVIVISADLQEPEELITKFVKAHREEGYEVAIGERIARNDRFMKNLTSRMYFRLMRISNPKVPKGGFDCFFLSRKAANAYLSLTDKIRIHHVDILWIGFKVKFVPYERRARTVGISQYNFRRQLLGALNGILNSSVWPVRMISAFGIVVSLLGFIYAVAIFIAYFKGSLIPGWTPVMMSVLIIGGLILFMLGIIGEYIWRIYYEAKARPLYIIDEVWESETKETKP